MSSSKMAKLRGHLIQSLKKKHRVYWGKSNKFVPFGKQAIAKTGLSYKVLIKISRSNPREHICRALQSLECQGANTLF